ncbi:MAG: hypothetical protein R3C44_05870 [Chloroflexota bacterium]
MTSHTIAMVQWLTLVAHPSNYSRVVTEALFGILPIVVAIFAPSDLGRNFAGTSGFFSMQGY